MCQCFQCSYVCAPKKSKYTNKNKTKKTSDLCGFNRNVLRNESLCFEDLKILSFKDCLVYQNSFLKIPKSQLGYVSYVFLDLFTIFGLVIFKDMFIIIKKTTSTCRGSMSLLKH